MSSDSDMNEQDLPDEAPQLQTSPRSVASDERGLLYSTSDASSWEHQAQGKAPRGHTAGAYSCGDVRVRAGGEPAVAGMETITADHVEPGDTLSLSMEREEPVLGKGRMQDQQVQDAPGAAAARTLDVRDKSHRMRPAASADGSLQSS